MSVSPDNSDLTFKNQKYQRSTTMVSLTQYIYILFIKIKHGGFAEITACFRQHSNMIYTKMVTCC